MKRTEKIKRYGFFNVDKPSGITSSAVVNKCKWLTATPCGHMGTLDPLASGVLPVGVGSATKLFNYFLEKEKEYIAEFTFGVSSDTLDSTAELIVGGRIPTAEEICAVLPSFFGEIDQIPPKYSAKNLNGKRGYELARAGIAFELPPKKVRINGIDLLEKAGDTYRFKINCGGGTYIRSLARDIAQSLGTNAVMSALRRTKSGVFVIDKSIPFSLLESDPSISELEKYLIYTEDVLPFNNLEVTKKNAEKLFHGVSVDATQADGLYKIYQNDLFYGLVEVVDGRAKIKTKLC